MNTTNKMEIIETSDGSPTIYSHQYDEIYHSRRGAIEESQYVFIKMGLQHIASEKDEIRILEVGMGTGLNVFLSLLANDELEKQIHYTAIEAFPLSREIISQLKSLAFERIHGSESGQKVSLSDLFELSVHYEKVMEFSSKELFDLVYFDAFGPKKQPEIWEKNVFQYIFSLMSRNGILVTYCAKGDVRRTMESIGFQVDRLEGPPGKREMLRARKV